MKRVVEKVQFIPKMPVLLNVAAYARVSSGKDAMLHPRHHFVDFFIGHDNSFVIKDSSSSAPCSSAGVL